MTENALPCKIIGSALEVHKNFGADLLGNAYEQTLPYRLGEIRLCCKTTVMSAINT